MRLRRSIIGATPLFVAVFLLTASCAKVQPHFTVPKMTVSDPSFIPTMEAYTASTVSRGNRVDFLLNGQKIFPAQLAAIRSAQRTITYAQYFYEDGKPAVLLVEAISERCRAGVRGHVLLDAFGSLKMPPELRQQLQDAGCEVATFRPLRPWALDEANNRNHRRILVVDGKVGFTGGSGASSKWMGNGRREGHWRETDARMEGPAVNDLQGAFAENWLEATGHVLGGDGYFAPQPARGTVRAQVVRSSPTNGSFAVYTMYLLAMSSARRNIYMTNPYFLPDEQMRKALVEARRRGVRVVLLLPGAIDNNIVRQASRGGFGELLDAGIEIHEYRSGLLHAKTMAVDGLWATVGSTNVDNRSFALNDELNLALYDAETAAGLEKIFIDDLQHSRPVDPAVWRARGPMTRMLELISMPFKPQL
jgi:cardiolipin synthase